MAGTLELDQTPSRRVNGELQDLISRLNGYSKQDIRADSWHWKLSSNGLFTTKNLTRLIDDAILQDGKTRHQTLRNNLVPLKVEVFMWRVLNRRIPARTELDKRGIDLDSVYKWWNLGGVSNLSLNEAFQGKCNHALSLSGSLIWQALEWTCRYLIWRNQNHKVFSSKCWNGSTTLMEIQLKSFEWIASRYKKEKIEWLEWLSNPIKYCI
ncbi:uncharacterized protein [Rutidosis leptorrhynchoides]|uniref:uncharacterized protein n=1 Tax=Rutidosis leptorrhynchoides TaxID=125765 RepID=UPI003A9A3FBA